MKVNNKHLSVIIFLPSVILYYTHFCMVSFTQHCYFEIHSILCMYQQFFLPAAEQYSARHFSYSSFKLLQIELLGTVVYKSLCRYMLSFVFGKYIGVEQLAHMVVMFHLKKYFIAPGLSCDMRNLRSLLRHVRSLVRACEIQFPDQ